MIKEEIAEALKKSVTVICMLPVITEVQTVSVHVVCCCLCAVVSSGKQCQLEGVVYD